MNQELVYSNPLWDGYMADPFVLALPHGGGYYAYGTTPTIQPDGRFFAVLFSPDLAHWEYVGGTLTPRRDLPLDADYWAPAVTRRGDGKFLLYYSAAPSTDVLQHRLRVAVSDHPAGPFADAGYDVLSSDGFTIDADPFCDPRTGDYFLFYAKDVLDGERVGTTLAVVPLADDLMTTAGEGQVMLRPFADWQIYERNRTLYDRQFSAWHTLEGPSVTFHEGKYYCLYSGGNWQTDGYGVSFAVADHPLGPWQSATQSGPVVLRGAPKRGVIGPGHNSLVRLPNGTEMVVYHAWDATHTARRLWMDVLHWTPNGPVCDGPTTGEQSVFLG